MNPPRFTNRAPRVSVDAQHQSRKRNMLSDGEASSEVCARRARVGKTLFVPADEGEDEELAALWGIAPASHVELVTAALEELRLQRQAPSACG